MSEASEPHCRKPAIPFRFATAERPEQCATSSVHLASAFVARALAPDWAALVF